MSLYTLMTYNYFTGMFDWIRDSKNRITIYESLRNAKIAKEFYKRNTKYENIKIVGLSLNFREVI